MARLQDDTTAKRSSRTDDERQIVTIDEGRRCSGDPNCSSENCNRPLQPEAGLQSEVPRALDADALERLTQYFRILLEWDEHWNSDREAA